MARDTGAIRYLEPALRDTQVFRVYSEYDFDRTPQYLPPTRICDYVYCKICTLRGIDVRKRVYEASGMSEAEIYRHLSNFRDPLSLNNRDCMIRIWDKLIAEYLSEK